MNEPRTIYKVFFKNGQTVTLKGRSSSRSAKDNFFEIYRDERRNVLAARFELSEIVGVTFDKEC